MGMIAYARDLRSSPYAYMLSKKNAHDVVRLFVRDFCLLLNMSSEAPLYISTTVGATALPTIIKMATIMKEKRNEWSAQNELPAEISLLDSNKYH